MLNQLTSTRFFAAMAVVLYHYGGSLHPFNNHNALVLLRYSSSAVSYFFILSGFVMIIAYGNRPGKIDKIKYYVNRIARIYPVYFLALIWATLTSILTKQGVDPTTFTLSLFVIQAWFPDYVLTLNIPGWSLSVEFVFYFLFPFLLILYKKIKLQKISAVVLSIWIVSQLIFNYFLNYHPEKIENNFLFFSPIMHLNQFLIGNLIGLVYLKVERRNLDIVVALMMICLPVIILTANKYAPNISFHDGLLAIFFAPFILLMALNNGKISHVLSKKVFVVLGEISYSIYILQRPIHSSVAFVSRFLEIDNISMEYVFIVILIIASFISYYFVEIPARNLIQNLFSKRILTDK